jgi:hypothetical protein
MRLLEFADGSLHAALGRFVALVYHCFDRIVIQGYLPLLTREEHIVHFFRDVHAIDPITKDVLRQRTTEYQQWIEAFARNHRIPIEWADNKQLKAKGLKREDYVRPYCARMTRRHPFGVDFIFQSMEQGPTFLSMYSAIIMGSPFLAPNPRDDAGLQRPTAELGSGLFASSLQADSSAISGAGRAGRRVHADSHDSVGQRRGAVN